MAKNSLTEVGLDQLDGVDGGSCYQRCETVCDGGSSYRRTYRRSRSSGSYTSRPRTYHRSVSSYSRSGGGFEYSSYSTTTPCDTTNIVINGGGGGYTMRSYT